MSFFIVCNVHFYEPSMSGWYMTLGLIPYLIFSTFNYLLIKIKFKKSKNIITLVIISLLFPLVLFSLYYFENSRTIGVQLLYNLSINIITLLFFLKRYYEVDLK